MVKKVCAGCARLATVGLIGVAVARLFRKRHDAHHRPLIHRLIPR